MARISDLQSDHDGSIPSAPTNWFIYNLREGFPVKETPEVLIKKWSNKTHSCSPKGATLIIADWDITILRPK